MIRWLEHQKPFQDSELPKSNRSHEFKSNPVLIPESKVEDDKRSVNSSPVCTRPLPTPIDFKVQELKIEEIQSKNDEVEIQN